MGIGLEEAPSTTERQSDEEPSKHPPLRRVVLYVLPALLFVGLLGVGLFKASPSVKPGAKAPEFDLETLDGEGRISSSQLQGKPVVVNFWASWCIPCREEAPVLERTWRKYKDQGVVFVGIDIQDFREDALAFVDEFDLTYPQVRAPGRETAAAWGVTGVPETFFIDHRWRFLSIVQGKALGQQRGIVVRGAISGPRLTSGVEALIEQAAEAKR